MWHECHPVLNRKHAGDVEEAATLHLNVGLTISPAFPVEERGTSPESAIQGSNSNIERNQAGVHPSRLGGCRQSQMGIMKNQILTYTFDCCREIQAPYHGGPI